MKNVYRSLIATLTIALPFQAASVNLLKANDDFKDKQYEQAFIEYQQGAKVGSAHAYYQLGVMYSEGLGVEADLTNSLLYFSLAAGQNYDKADQILDSMLTQLNPEQKTQIHSLLKDFKKEQKQYVQQFSPEIIEENLAYKVTFDGKPALEKKVFIDLPAEDFNMSFHEESPIFVSRTKPSFLIVENDIAKDGSVRNINKIQHSGLTNSYIDEYKLFPIAKPEFRGKPVEFITRSFMGIATEGKFGLHGERPRIYGAIRNIVRRAEQTKNLNDQHQYAMAMLNFPWLEETPGQAEKLLKELSEQGHPAAMYEYGFKLYTEQREIPEAVKWITEASKYGLARAEYRLGKLLTSSPWVKPDEQKALFWFESAMEKNHNAATLYAAKIKLTSQDPSIKDVSGAIEYLAKAEKSQRLNPEYFHLLALSHKYRPDRNFKHAIENLERAIFMGSQANWDVTEWQDLLNQFTTGSVTISES